MVAFHDRFSRQMRTRLKTIGMGLGLVRLLQDAGRIGEARTMLSLLESGFQGVPLQRSKPSQQACRASRRRLSVMARSA
jgi:hypothetical protein